MLVIDGVKVQDFRTLVNLPPRGIQKIRIISGTESSVHYGIFATNGAIIVCTIRPEPVAPDTSSAVIAS